MIPGIVAGGAGSPIKIIYQDATGFDSSAATFSALCPDPSTYLAAGDVVIYTACVMNGFINTAGANNGVPVGDWVYGAEYYGDPDRSYQLLGYARRITSAGSIPQADRRFSFYVNYIGSSVVVTTTVLRGVAGTTNTDGVQVGASTTELTDFNTQDAAFVTVASGNANERTVTRANAKSLAIAHHYAFAAGTVGDKPAGWKDGLRYDGPGSNRVFSESRYFPSTGTTTSIARSPRPSAGNSGVLLMHVHA